MRLLPNQVKHENIRYNLDLEVKAVLIVIDYKATVKSSLLRHIYIKHKNIRVNCNSCEYKATTKQHLKMHIKTQHDETRYDLKECNYVVSTKTNIKQHVQVTHENAN